jgi:rod shape-determining protein MreC
MRNLVQLILKYHFLIIFVVLQLFAFYLLVSGNNYQNNKFTNLTGDVSGSVLEHYHNFTNYINLNEKNDKLAEENAFLKQYEKYSLKKLFSDKVKIEDTLYQQQYLYMSAEVIDNSVSNKKNYILINKGRINGIMPEMGVISSDGVVGIVKSSSDNFSVIVSLLHIESKVSAFIEENNYFGSISWSGDDEQTLLLNDIPNYVSLKKGHHVKTSGYSSAFPKGVPIGIIKSFERVENGSFYNIDVEVSTDFRKLSHVYIVKDLMKMERQKIMEEATLND